MGTYDCLEYAAEEGVARIALDPEALNALNPPLLRELEDAIERAGAPMGFESSS